jgi:hypothetical protein
MRQTIEQVTDDLTGRDAPDARKVKVSFDGKPYEVDLSDGSAEALASFLSGKGTADLIRLLAPNVPASQRRSRSAARASGPVSGTGQIKLPDGRHVPRPDFMAWAEQHNMPVNVSRGAQPKQTLESYQHQHPAPGSIPAAPAPAAAPAAAESGKDAPADSKPSAGSAGKAPAGSGSGKPAA